MDITTQTPLRRAFNALIEVGRDLHARLTAKNTAHLPRPLRRNPATAASRIAATLDWLAALARTLAGDPFFLHAYRLPAYPRFPGRYPSLTNDIRISCGLEPNPPSTPEQRAARRLRHIRDVFSTQPTGTIAARLARRLGLTPKDAAWPTDLVAVAETPMAYNRRVWATKAKSQAAPEASPTPDTPLITPNPNTPPAYHPRE